MTFLDFWYGVIGLSIPAAIVFVLVTTQITFVAITVYLHRHSAHRALDLHPALQHVFRFWLWLTTGMATKAWTAVHRKHHALTETVEDPHSPVIHGLGEILFKGTEYYREAVTPETLEKYGKGTPDDWLEHNVYGSRDRLGVGLLMAIDIVLFGAVGVVIWGIQMMWVPFWAAGVINGIGHAWGYRNFECPDAAKNIVPWGILICGEELHNNHHTYPNSPKLSVKPWEFDAGWMWIRIFQSFGLATPKAVGPVIARSSPKERIDIDTVWAVLNDRFRVMANFRSNVVDPIVASLSSNANDSATRRLLRRAKKVICRDDSLVDDHDRKHLLEIAERFPSLHWIYEQRVALSRVWSKRTGTREELLQAFVAWCRTAEDSQFEVLQNFVKDLRCYSMPRLAVNSSL